MPDRKKLAERLKERVDELEDEAEENFDEGVGQVRMTTAKLKDHAERLRRGGGDEDTVSRIRDQMEKLDAAVEENTREGREHLEKLVDEAGETVDALAEEIGEKAEEVKEETDEFMQKARDALEGDED
jgi:methyl-accepting chemotaxis protein